MNERLEGNPRTRGVIEADQFLAMPREQAKEATGIKTDADYARVYRDIESAAIERDRAQARTGVRASIVIKKRGTPVADTSLFEKD